MKIRALLVAMSVATVLTGCQNMDSNGLLSSGAEAFQAYSLSDAQVKTLSDQACQEMDSKATIAPANSEYAKRLTTIANALGNNINGQPVNYSAAIFLIPICISFDTAEKRRYATYLILNRRFSFEF